MTHTTRSPKAVPAVADAPLKVGALATRTGLSVRTLHHYDEIALLSPSQRTPSGHRLYGVDDIARLQQIQALRIMGLSLDEIRGLLDGPGFAPHRVIQLQLHRLEQQIALQQRLADRLKLLARQLNHAAQISVEQLCRIIEETTMMDKHFTPEQLITLKARGDALGPDAIREVEHSWADIIPAVRAHMERETPPTDPDLQALARRWKELVDAFTGGDRELARSVRSMYDQEHASLSAQHANTPDPAMFAYMSQVFARIGGGPG